MLLVASEGDTNMVRYNEKYFVGYGKPPEHSKFKAGQSGNPRGRARAEEFRKWENPIHKYMLEAIPVVIDGKKKTMVTVDALMKVLIAKSLKGCTKSLKILLDNSGGLKALIAEEERKMTEADKKYLEDVRKTCEQWAIDHDVCVKDK
jgi:hypothetical protein